MDALVSGGCAFHGRERQRILFKMAILLAFLFAGPGGGLIQSASASSAHPVGLSQQQEDQSSSNDGSPWDSTRFSEAVETAVRLVLAGVLGIVIIGILLAYVLISTPELKKARPFDPEKERHETREGPLRLM